MIEYLKSKISSKLVMYYRNNNICLIDVGVAIENDSLEIFEVPLFSKMYQIQFHNFVLSFSIVNSWIVM